METETPARLPSSLPAGQIREIVKYGHPVLRLKGKRIEQADAEVRQLAADMLETMYAAHGLGLAAQQVGVARLITVVDVSQVDLDDRPSTLLVDDQAVNLADWMPLVLLNPELELVGPERAVASEGCLSFPDINGEVSRAARVRARATLLDGRRVEFEATGLLARALQHEFDHLQGILFTDRMSTATKVGLGGRLKRLQREGAAAAHERP